MKKQSSNAHIDDFCAEVGMNSSVAVNMLASPVLRVNRLPFEITTESDLFLVIATLRIFVGELPRLMLEKGLNMALLRYRYENHLVRRGAGRLHLLAVTR